MNFDKPRSCNRPLPGPVQEEIDIAINICQGTYETVKYRVRYLLKGSGSRSKTFDCFNHAELLKNELSSRGFPATMEIITTTSEPK